MKKSPALLVAAVACVGVTSVWLSQPRNESTRVAASTEKTAVGLSPKAVDSPVFTRPERVSTNSDTPFSNLENLVEGDVISLPLPDGRHVQGTLNYVKTHPNAAAAAGGTLADGGGIFEIAREPGYYRGFILPKTGRTAYVYSGEVEGGVQVASRPSGEVVCEPDPNFKPLAQSDIPDPQKAAIYNDGRSVGIIYEAIPILHSLPRAAATIYLDFDGEVIEGQSWEGGRRIIASAYNLPASEVTDMWRRVAEDFAPYEVNVTTDLQAYLRAPQGRRMRCIVTPSNFAPGAGGIAFGGTFLQSGDTCCWVFMTGKAGSDAISHEVGHTLGLHHDGIGDQGYFGGYGSGTTSWGPIMGAPYGANVAQWSKGEYPSANQSQDDLLVMGSNTPLIADDHGPTTAQATALKLAASGAVSNSGVIDSPNDVDAFTFTTNGGALNLQFNGAVNSPNLDIEAKLYNSAGTLIATASPANQLSATLSTSVGAGSYTVTVDGVGYATWATTGYGDYGSLGAYTITGTVPTAKWAFTIPRNALAGAVLGTVAPGTGSAFSISAGNTGNAFSINSTTGVVSVATAGALSTTSFNLTVGYTANGTPTSTVVPVNVIALRGLKQQIWTGLGGNGIGPLTSLGSYPNSPSQTRYAPIFQTTLDLDNYGQKLSGYLLPTETGNHTFWISSDDYSEVWLSTDANPSNKVKIINLYAVTSPGEFTGNAAQQSAAIPLVAGQRYYIEVLHREQTGGDHLAVAWQTPTLARHYIPNANLEYPGTWVNRTPWIASSTYRVREDAAVTTAIGNLTAGDYEPGSVLSNYSITAGNTGNAFAMNPTTGMLSVNGALSFATLPEYFLTVQATDSGGLTTSSQIAVEVEPRAVKRQLWTGVDGTAIANLTSLGTYPNNPNSTTYQAFFETPTNSADNYGQKLSGYLRAPETGSYTFWIASDDEGELWLSTDTSTANRVRVAYTLNATNSREWEKFASQKSATINLVGGKFYYIEALNKEGGGGDNLAVSWSGPDFDRRILGAPNVTQQFYNHGAPVLNNRTVSIFDRDDVVTTLEAKDWSAPGTQVTYTITAGNDDGAFAIDPLTGVIRRNVPILPTGNRVLTITATDNGVPALSDTAQITVQVQKAGMKREVWTGLSNSNDLASLTTSLYFPYKPSQRGFTQNFQAPSGFGDNYGQRLSGYLVPPATGTYTLWIASDDGGELWISSDTNPSNKRKIASVTGSVGQTQWNAQAGQQSVGIPLEAGHYYYIEAIQKEGAGGDHLAVAWQGPGITQAVISGNYLEYPDSYRPGLKREFFNSASATKWSPVNEWNTAAATYTEGFAATGALNGNSADTGSATWGASTGWVRNNGVATKSAAGDAHALLPFVPQSGNIYTLSLEIDPTNSPASTDWFALGFTNQPATNTSLYTQTFLFPSIGQSWMLVRANGSDGGTMSAFSSALANPIATSPSVSAVGAYDTISVTLDTRNANWVSNYYFNGALQGTHTHNGAPTILSAGISSYGAAVGNVRNFRLTSTGSGTAGALFNLKSRGLGEEGFSERLTGFIIPPATGAYTFWIASDDEGQMLLSTDENPANLAEIAFVSGYTAEEAWDVLTSQKSAVKQLVAGKRYYFQVNHRDGSFGDHVAVAWQGPGITRQVISNNYLEHPTAPADRSLFQREVWNGISGDNMSDLTSAANFPTSPDTTGTLSAAAGLAAPANAAETFGERIRGYLVAPEDGRYTFWIASDAGGELWLSSDENPANRIRIASVSGAVGAQAWDTQASQKSVPIALLTGKRYYLEVLHKEGNGADHAAVAWQGPSFDRRVIANAYLENPLVIPGKASLKREVWTGLTNSTTVASLTSNANFVTGKPNARGILTTFESPSTFGELFGERVTGLLIPPETGNYKFWIASDAASELWISTDSNPANRMRIAYTTSATTARNWTQFPSQESGTLILVAGQRYHIEVLHRESTGADHMAVAWQGPSFSRQIIDGRFLEYPGTIPDPAYLNRQIWTNIGGNNVSDLTNKSNYPATPNQTKTLDTFETPINESDNYGQKISGYLIAPATGNYQFWIASDDGGELWLSPTDVQSSKTRIAYTTGATGIKNWTNNANQASASIALTAGQRCYIEALHKEGGGDDYLAVAWQGPGFSQQVIGSDFLQFPGLVPSTTQSGALVPAATIDNSYTFWLNHAGLAGNDRLAHADPDKDGIPNSLEFILGGIPSGAGANSIALLPKLSTDETHAIFEYRLADVAQAIAPFAEFGTTLSSWARANNGVNGIQITTENDAFGPGVDKVTVRVPRTDIPQIFMRLNANTQ